MAISLDASSSGRAGATNPFTVSHTTGSGTDRLLVAVTTVQDSNHANYPITKITYAGLSLVKLRHDEPAGNVRTEIWYLFDPPVGTYSCTATFTGTVGEKSLGVITFFGADPILDANNGATGSGVTPSVSLTTVVNNAWSITVAAAEGAFSAINNSQTALTGYPLTDQSYENAYAGYRGPITPQGATTLSYTCASAVWAISAVSIQPKISTFRTLIQGSI